MGGDGFDIGDHTAVVVGDEGDVDDGHSEFVTQVALWILGHVDDVPAHLGEPFRFGFGAEPWPLDDDDGAAVVTDDVMFADRFDRQFAEGFVVHIRRGDVAGDGAVVERVVATLGAVNELVGDHKVAGFDFSLKGSDGAGGDDRFDTKFVESPDVGAIVDFVRREGVVPSVAGEEGDFAAGDFGEHDAVGGRAVGRIDFDFGDVFEEAVEAGAPEDADFGD